MPNDKVTIEISRADAEKVCTLLGSVNGHDTAAILSHTGYNDALEMYDIYKALTRVYYQIRVTLEGPRINP